MALRGLRSSACLLALAGLLLAQLTASAPAAVGAGPTASPTEATAQPTPAPSPAPSGDPAPAGGGGPTPPPASGAAETEATASATALCGSAGPGPITFGPTVDMYVTAILGNAGALSNLYEGVSASNLLQASKDHQGQVEVVPNRQELRLTIRTPQFGTSYSNLSDHARVALDEGDGYYEIATTAADWAGSVEPLPATGDAAVHRGPIVEPVANLAGTAQPRMRGDRGQPTASSQRVRS